MQELVRRFLDNSLSRRELLRRTTALGLSLASAQALAASLQDARAGKPATAVPAESATEISGSGAELLVGTLAAGGVTSLFHGCGAGINDIFDAVVERPGMRNFLATNEGQAVAMAEGFHIASGGKPGVAIIPKPGLPNAAGNIHNAFVNRSSLIIITARESSEYSHRRGNIELVDWDQAMNPFMKSSLRMERVERIPEFTRRAEKVALTRPGGPVFLEFTEDLYASHGSAKVYDSGKFEVSARLRGDPGLIDRAARMLLEAKRPWIVAGLEVTRSSAQADLQSLAELLAIPVSQGLSAFADFPNQHPLHMGLYSRYLSYNRECDLFVVIGTQMPDAGNYQFTGPPPAGAKIIHISLEPDVLAQWQATDVSILADAGEAIRDIREAVAGLATRRRIDAIRRSREAAVTTIAARESSNIRERARGNWDQSPLTYARISTELDKALEHDAIVVSESLYGVAQWFDFGPGRKMQIGPQPGEVLGWATGVALGAKLAQPDRQVVALSGDGAFMFQNALWSLARYQAPVLVVVYNNRAYNMNRAFPWLKGGAQARLGKDLVTYLGDPDVDFVSYARAFSVAGEHVESPAALGGAIDRGLAALRDGKPYLLDVSAERWGTGGRFTWHPEISIAGMRRRAV